jgi:hypothetical protein
MFTELGVDVSASSYQGMLAAALRASASTTIPTPKAPSKPPVIPDAKLRTWLESYALKHPVAVYREIKPAAEAKFPSLRIGKNQLYRVMKQVYGHLKIGNPSISRP